METIKLVAKLNKPDIILLSLISVVCQQKCGGTQVDKMKNDSGFTITVDSTEEGHVLAAFLEEEFAGKFEETKVIVDEDE